MQPYADLVCRLMVFTPVIDVITWITTHLPTQRLSWLGWLTPSRHFTQKVI